MTRVRDPDPVTIHPVGEWGYHLLYLTPCSCLKKHLDQFLAPYRVYRGCFFAGSQKAEKQKGFMTILLVVKLTSATSIFSLFPFSHRSIPPSPSFPPPPSSNTHKQSSLPPPPHLSSVRLSYFPLLSYQKQLLERIVCLSPHSMEKLQ